MTKHIKAPKTYNPGKGRPLEHLAYLNEREMAYLRSINGDNMERGPKNLPSFPPDDSLGSSSKSDSKSSGKSSATGGGNKGSSGRSSGPGGPNGPNSGPSRSSGSSSKRSGPGGPSGPNSGPSKSGSGSRGAGSNYGPGSGRPGVGSSLGRGFKSGPSSPMGGQGPSFSRDNLDRQRAQVRDAIAAVKNSPAFRNDARVAGIRTINVGPMQTPVKVGKTSLPPGLHKTGVTIDRLTPKTPQPYGVNTPYTTPGVLPPEEIGRRIKEMNRLEEEMRKAGLINKVNVTPTGNPNMAGAMFTGPKTITPTGNPNLVGAGLRKQATVTPTGNPTLVGANITYPKGMLPAPTLPERMNIGQVYGPTLPDFSLPGKIVSIEDVPLPNESIHYKTSLTDPPSIAVEAPRKVGPGGLFSPGIYNDELTRMKLADLVKDVPTPPKTRGIKLDQKAKPQGVEAVGGGGMLGTFAPDAPISFDVAKLSPAKRNSVYNGPKAPSTKNVAQDDGINPEDRKHISPVEQQPAMPEQTPIERLAGWLPGGVGLLSRGARWGVEKLFEHMTPAEQAAQLAKWSRDRDQYIRNRGPSNDRGMEPDRPTQGGFGGTAPLPTTTPEEPVDKGKIPAQYYYWDLGIDIPSPNESDYTLYLKYLKDKAAANAAV